MSQELFSCFLQIDYPDCVYLYERRLHIRKTQYLHAITELHLLSPLADKIDALFCVLMDCAALRRRVTDHTIFRLCTNELKYIDDEIASVMLSIIKQAKQSNNLLNAEITIDTYPLEENIKRLEATYFSVLRVTSREPLVFVLFIESLKVLRERLEAFNASRN